MKMNKFYKKIFKVATLLGAATLASCGGSGNCFDSTVTGNLSLALTAPNQFPAGVPVTAYLTMTNTSNVNATNLVYDIPSASNYTGTAITVNNTSNPCKNISSGKSCTFPVQITNVPISHPGRFTVTATPNVSSANSVLASLKSVMGFSIDQCNRAEYNGRLN